MKLRLVIPAQLSLGLYDRAPQPVDVYDYDADQNYITYM